MLLLLDKLNVYNIQRCSTRIHMDEKNLYLKSIWNVLAVGTQLTGVSCQGCLGVQGDEDSQGIGDAQGSWDLRG